MILGLGMSQAGRDKNTNWKFYFIYRKCRVNPFLKSMTSREAGQGGEGRTVRDTRSLRYTVTLLSRCSYTGTLLHFCYTALARCYTSVTPHWHTVTRDPASGPRPGLTEISEWNQAEPGPGLSITLYSLDTREMVK